MFDFLILVKIFSIVLVVGVIQIIAFWRYKKESMKYQFEALLGIANSFISGLLLTSSLVYLLPESYNLHIAHHSDALNSFPWIFSVFCGAFGLISILTQFYTFDKYFRKRIIADYFEFEKNGGHQDQYDISEIYEEHSQFKASNQLHYNQPQQPRQNLHRFSQNLHNPKDSYVTNKLSYSITTPLGGTYGKGHHACDDDNHLVTPGHYYDYFEYRNEFTNYKPQYLYLIYCIHSFFECSAIGLQKEILSTIVISLTIFLHKWFEVLFIQMQTKLSYSKANQSYFLIIIYTLSNIGGIGFGWTAQTFFNDIYQAVFVSISGGTFFAISINDLLHAEINKGNKYRITKILLFIISIGLINLAWYAQKQLSDTTV